MTTSHTHHHVGDTRFAVLFTLAHAAVALPALRLWAEWCSRHKRPRW